MGRILVSTGATHASVRNSWMKIWSRRILKQAENEQHSNGRLRTILDGLLDAHGMPSVCVLMCLYYVLVIVLPQNVPQWQPLLYWLICFVIPALLQIMRN